MTKTPTDWFKPGTDGGERCYWITREGGIMLAMWSDGKVATQAKVVRKNLAAIPGTNNLRR